MKTLKEQVEEIKNMKGPKSAKKAAFVKLGLRKYEVELLMSELPKTIRETHKFTFGVEIECLVAGLYLILLSEVKILSNVCRQFLRVRQV